MVLSQEVDGVDRLVLYLSRKLVEREEMYSTVEKGCLATKWVVGALRYYLLGRAFTLCSDHAPLWWLHRMKDTNPRNTRWYMVLQPYSFQVIHRLVVADFRSRLLEQGGWGTGAGLALAGETRGVEWPEIDAAVGDERD